MVHRMHLQKEPFEKIKNRRKTIELRLYDEKRQRISVDDEIVFTQDQESTEILIAKVTALHRFDSFAQLYASLPLDRCGYAEDEISQADANDMNAYYGEAQQRQYGVLGIEFILLKDSNEHI